MASSDMFDAEKNEITEKGKKFGLHFCPVCGKHVFGGFATLLKCPVCGWYDEYALIKDPDANGSLNVRTLNEAIEAYKNGESVDCGL